MIYSPGFTAPDGKTYRNLVPQVYYLTEKVEELIAGGGGSSGDGSKMSVHYLYLYPYSFVVQDPGATFKTYIYTLNLPSELTTPSVIFTTNVDLASYGIYPSLNGNQFMLQSYSAIPSNFACNLTVIAFETLPGTAQGGITQIKEPQQPRYLGTLQIGSPDWHQDPLTNYYRATIPLSRIAGYKATGLTVFIPIQQSDLIIRTNDIYLEQSTIVGDLSLASRDAVSAPAELNFLVYTIPVEGQTSATVALL